MNYSDLTGLEVAIVGMAGRFPGAQSIGELWDNLKQGKESISFFSEEQLAKSGVPKEAWGDPNYVRAKGVLEDADKFDAAFFGFSPREAQMMDPQQRIFLECVWEALENAGYDPEQYKGLIGLFAGAGQNYYLLFNLLPRLGLKGLVENSAMMVSASNDFLATLPSYKLNLRGPGVLVQTACSTSLVAIHMACQSLLTGECDMALAGGVQIMLPQEDGYMYRLGGINSPDGHCRAFDEKAAGTVVGNGQGIVVLKKLANAIADGDTIHAVIKGSAINNDGALKVGYTAPSVDGQASVISEALSVTGIDPETIQYVETHGTGTALGDPIEMKALTEAFREQTDKTGYCAVGSLKSNIGHLGAAAGVAGLIKTVTAMQNEIIPPSLHYQTPNPKIDFANSPFYVNAQPRPWKKGDEPRRAGVSSFGIGGTNAHLIVEEAPEQKSVAADDTPQLLVLSARSAKALEQATQNLAEHLKKHPQLNLADAAYTLRSGRKKFDRRRALVATSAADALQQLEAKLPQQVYTGQGADGQKVAFMFPGQGSQYVNMTEDLYRVSSTFRAVIDNCAELLQPHLGLDIRDVLYPKPGQEETARGLINETRLAQPLLFTVEYALAQVWMEWGIQPDAMIGHSIGEYTAACLAGVFSLEDALLLVSARGELMQSVPRGSMLSVPLPEELTGKLLTPDLSLAAVNGPSLCVVAGPTSSIERLQAELAEREIESRILQTSHAFHSHMVDPILERFAEKAGQVRLKKPELRWISGLTGEWITEGQATDPLYWVRHLREAVLFAKGVAKLQESGPYVYLEAGPGVTLSTFVKQCVSTAVTHASVQHPTRKEMSDDAFLQLTLGKLWSDGVTIDWLNVYEKEGRRRIPLPTYPFERKRYWIEAPYHALYADPASLPELATLGGLDESQETDLVEREIEEGHKAPRTELERTICSVWEEMLGTAPIGVDDNFFLLGGHSLLGLQVLNRMKKVLQLELPLSLILEAPTVSQMAAEVGKRQETSVAEALISDELPQIVPNLEERSQPFPLSDLAQAYFVGRSQEIEMGNVGSHIYYELASVDLDLERFEKALQRLVERHEMLRAVVREDGAQVILPEVPAYKIHVQDLSGQTPAEQEAGQLALRQEINYTVPDPGAWPLWAVQGTRTDDHRVILHIRFDYLIIDALSIEILSREWEEFYQNPDEELPPLTLSYRDYMQTLTAFQETPLYRKAKSYWQERIQTMPPPPQLPVQRKKLQTPKLIGRQDKLTQAQWSALQARANEAGLTPSGVICSVYAEVLATWSETKNFMINLPIFGRLPMHEQVNDIVGTFTMNTFLEFNREGGDTFEARARRLQTQMMTDLDHRYYTGVNILRDLNRLHTDGSRDLMPVIFTGFVKHDNPTRKWSWIDWVGEKVFGSNQSPQIWIDHQVWEDDDGGLFFKWDMLEEVFPAGLADAMFTAYRQLLHDLSAAESKWQANDPVTLPADQLAQRDANNRPHGDVSDVLMQELFAVAAAQHPNAIAVLAPGMEMNYRELETRSWQLAHLLREKGAQVNTLIAVAMEKGWEQIVATMAILQAGAAYLPVDPSLPQERMHQLLEQGGATVVITQEHLADKLFWPPGTDIVTVPQTAAEVGAYQPFPTVQQAGDLAYVIFTSGSTGTPKGVMIDHRGAVNTLLDVNERFSVGREDRVLMLSNLNFDLSVYDVFGTLAAGGTIVVPSAEFERDPHYLVDLIRKTGVTVYNSVPALLEMIVDQLSFQPTADPLPLRVAMMSGDWIPLNLPDRARALMPALDVNSLGGATEASIWSITYPIGKVDPAWKSIPYGKPMKNQSFHVLTEGMEPCPVHVPGNLYIGGVGLAQGYWRDEERTNASFVTWAKTGERLYKTGDLGRFLPDGNIEFLGRADHQVKIRGYRIEQGEIESMLLKHEGVAEAVVHVHESQAGGKQLAAYVVPQTTAVRTASEDVSDPVAKWREVFEETYGAEAEQTEADPAFNIAGWHSSYTGDQLPDADMAEWVDNTVERILAQKPKRVLEIGCGSGLLLQRIAPHCELYVASDFSQQAIDRLSRLIDRQDLSQVRLHCRTADDFAAFAGAEFDLVIINSVIQYFSDAQYLLEVLEKAVAHVSPGGALFLGDLRNRALLEAFHASIQASRTEGHLDLDIFQQRVEGGVEADRELLIAPAFFRVLAERLPQITDFDLLLKRGKYQNEMTRFRYDAIVRVGRELPFVKPVWSQWPEPGLSREQIEALLAQTPNGVLGLQGIPNKRVQTDVNLYRLIQTAEVNMPAAELSARAAELAAAAVDPEWFWQLGDDLSCEVLLSWKGSDETGRFDAVLIAPAALPQGLFTVAYTLQELETADLGRLVTNPLQKEFQKALVQDLNRFLSEKLPEYMVPSVIFTLDAIPLTANGKVDRKALPVPAAKSIRAAGDYTAPRTETEQRLTDIWSRILQTERISVHEHFFELGGDSLLATRILAQINSQFAVRLPLRTFYEQPTVARLAVELERIAPAAAELSMEDKMAQVLKELEDISTDDIERMLLELSVAQDGEE